MKKKILTVAALAMFAFAAVSGTLAYFTAEERVHNVITSGGVGIEIVEKTEADSGAEVDFPKEGIRDVMPGTSASKIVKIKNSGESDAWIRVKVESSIVDADGEDLPLMAGSDDKKPVMEYEILEGWIPGEDGYYYYEKPVAPGEFTGLFIDTVKFSPAMGNEYQGCTANIIIAAEAVQTANNGDRVMEAKGWPETGSEEGGN